MGRCHGIFPVACGNSAIPVLWANGGISDILVEITLASVDADAMLVLTIEFMAMLDYLPTLDPRIASTEVAERTEATLPNMRNANVPIAIPSTSAEVAKGTECAS